MRRCSLHSLPVRGKKKLNDILIIQPIAKPHLRIGMEFLRVPAGRLATVFYKTEPQGLTSNQSSLPFDVEKANSDETLPPITQEKSKRSARISRELSDTKGHAFAWKNISLDIKVNGDRKRLLDGIDGKLSYFKGCATFFNHWDRLCKQRSNDRFDGCIGSWEGDFTSNK